MPNLYLSYPAIPFDAVAREESVTFSEDRPASNVISGERYQYASATAGASGAIDLEYDLGVGNTSTVDHIIVANAKKLRDQGSTTLALDSAANGIGGTYSNVWTDANFGTATLYGTESKDYITHSLSLATNRTWKVKLSGGAATTREISKIYFGTTWNPEKDCDWSLSIVYPEGGRASTEDGGGKVAKLGDARLSISVTWVGVGDDALQIFNDRVLNYWQEHKFFLFTTGSHRILNDHRLLHVRLQAEPQVTTIKKLANNLPEGYSTITANFIEVKG
jgi:hypothetical protein